MDYAQIAETITPIAREAGQIALRHFRRPIEQGTKASAIDIVTEADKKVEVYISGEFLKLFPDHHFVGEEGGGQGASADEAEYFWYIDPIDGTTNFASGIPHFCTSIAMTDKQRNPLLGMIYDPTRDDLYLAIAGKGATVNGKALQVSSTSELIQAVLLTGFPYDRLTNPDNNFRQWQAFMMQTRAVRVMGSAALELASVAAGYVDGFWERALNPWDALAGMLLVREAGGMVTDYQGDDMPQCAEGGRYIASNGILHDAIQDVINHAYAG